MACAVGTHVDVCAGQSLNASTLNQKEVLSSECLLSFCSECFLPSCRSCPLKKNNTTSGKCKKNKKTKYRTRRRGREA